MSDISLLSRTGPRFDIDQCRLFGALADMKVTGYEFKQRGKLALMDFTIESTSAVEGWMHLVVEWQALKAGLKFEYASSSHNYPGHTMSRGFLIWAPAKFRTGVVNPNRATFNDVPPAVRRLQADFDKGCTNPGCSGRVHR